MTSELIIRRRQILKKNVTDNCRQNIVVKACLNWSLVPSRLWTPLSTSLAGKRRTSRVTQRISRKRSLRAALKMAGETKEVSKNQEMWKRWPQRIPVMICKRWLWTYQKGATQICWYQVWMITLWHQKAVQTEGWISAPAPGRDPWTIIRARPIQVSSRLLRNICLLLALPPHNLLKDKWSQL